MTKKGVYLSIIIVLCCLKSVAFADYYSREFGDMDLSRDDFVTFKEYKYYVSGATVESFRRIDTDKDEKIDFFEWVEFQEKNFLFESKRKFKYKGKSETWYLDRYGNRYKDKGGHYWGCKYDFRPDYWHDCRYRYHYGTYRFPCHAPTRSGLTIGVGLLF